MKNESTLDRLLKVEAEAAALVVDAQAEADRRIHDNEEKCRIAYDEFFRAELQKWESALENEKDRLKKQYQYELDNFRQKISGIDADEQRFSALLNEYIAKEG